jgi:hypothetical protein
MKNAGRFSGWLVAVAVICFGTYSFGQAANMTMSDPGNNVMNGVYVGPYNGTVNGVSAQIICDDFADESYSNESWTATVTTVANLNGTKWGNNTALYDEAAYFATQMIGLESNPTANAQTIGYMSYVIWALFDAKDVKNWLTSQGQSGINTWNAIQVYLASAGKYAGFTPPSNFFIFTPNLNNQITCNGGPCPTAPPQEFIGFVNMPEGGSPLTYLLFAGLACGLAVTLRSKLAGARQSI